MLVDALDRDEPTLRFLEGLADAGEELATTSVNVAEILRGSGDTAESWARAVRFLEAVTEVPVGPRASRRLGRLMHQLDRAGARIPVVDGLVAAVALESGARLVTRNRKHYRPVAGLEILSP